MSGEKTEKPTPKKRKKARREGQIAKSPEVAAWLGMLVSTMAVRWAGAAASHRVLALWAKVGHAIAHPEEGMATKLLGQGLAAGVLAVLPLSLVLLTAGVAANLAQSGLAFTTKGLTPKMSRLNPKQAIKRIFSAQGAWETLKSLAKVLVLGGLGWRTVRGMVGQLVGVGHLPVLAVAARTLDAALGFARDAAMIGLVLAAIDYAMARRRIGKGIRMTKHEVKEEGKQAEGNPEMKGHIRSMQRRMSRSRMVEAVPRADAIIVNPTHIAIAIAYNPGHRAPEVVARGAGEAAARIRALGEEHGIPIVRDVPLARTLFRLCAVGDQIPPQLFEAVARVLAFVYGLKRAGRIRRLDGDPHDLAQV